MSETQIPQESATPVDSSLEAAGIPDKQKGKKKPGLSRRSFLKAAAASTAMLVLGGSPGRKTEVEQKEVLKPSDRAVFVDMAPNYDNRALMQNLLGELYAPPEVLDLNSLNTFANISGLLENQDDRIVATLLANEVLKSRESHGETMGNRYVEALSTLGYAIEVPTILPLQEAFTNMEFGRDELGNPWASLKIDEQKIGDSLEDYLREKPNIRCINLSLQVGDIRTKQVLRRVIPLQKTNEFRIFDEATDMEFVTITTDIDSWAQTADGRFLPHRRVDGVLTPLRDDELLTDEQYRELNRQHEQQVIVDFRAGRPTDQIEQVFRTEITEAYNPLFARENLPRLIALCRRFPDKLFSVSGGNENSYFYEIRQEMEARGEWADNLIISAEKRFLQDLEVRSDGADVYLEPSRFNEIRMSSSEAAVRVSALASILANRGLTAQEIKRKIMTDFCIKDTYRGPEGIERDCLVLDPDLYSKELLLSIEN